MKKLATILIAAAAVSALAAQAFAAPPIFTEDFSYASGTALNGTGGWAAHSGAGTNPQTVNAAAGLSYVGYPSSGVGNGLGTLAASGEDNNHGFTGITSGSAYAALMVNVVSATTTGDYFFHFFDGLITGNAFKGRIFVKKDGASANYAFGIQMGSNTAGVVYTPFSYATGTTHLLVVKYTFNPGSPDDQASLFVDPVVGCSEPAATVTAVAQTSGSPDVDATNIDGVCIRQGGSSSGSTEQVDGIRVANNWADAVCSGVVPTHTSTWGALKGLYR